MSHIILLCQTFMSVFIALLFKLDNILLGKNKTTVHKTLESNFLGLFN
jgi:hypothetical protein